MQKKKVRFIIFLELVVVFVVVNAVHDYITAKTLAFRISYLAVSCLAVWAGLEVIRQYFLVLKAETAEKIAKAVQRVVIGIAVVIIASHFRVPLVEFEREYQVERKQQIKLLTSQTWRVRSVEKSCWTGMTNHFTTKITFEPTRRGKWIGEKPWVEFEDNGHFYVPDLWRAFLSDKRPEFRIRLDRNEDSYYPVMTNLPDCYGTAISLVAVNNGK